MLDDLILARDPREASARQIEQDIRDASDALRDRTISCIYRYAQQTNVTVEEALSVLLYGRKPPPTVAAIKTAVAKRYRLTRIEMDSARRGRNVARPRQIAMYVAHKLTGHSLAGLGRMFNRDHTTVMHGINRVSSLLEEDADFAREVNALLSDFDMERRETKSPPKAANEGDFAMRKSA